MTVGSGFAAFRSRALTAVLRGIVIIPPAGGFTHRRSAPTSKSTLAALLVTMIIYLYNRALLFSSQTAAG